MAIHVVVAVYSINTPSKYILIEKKRGKTLKLTTPSDFGARFEDDTFSLTDL
jgi:hypothetical protein